MGIQIATVCWYLALALFGVWIIDHELHNEQKQEERKMNETLMAESIELQEKGE